jgi:hypothetical protein
MTSRCPFVLVLVGVSALMSADCGTSQEPPVTVNQQTPASNQPPAEQPPAAQPSAPAAAPGAPPAEPAPTPAPASDAAAPAPSATTGSAATAQPIAVEDHEVPGVQVALMDVRRTSGDTVTVRLQFRNTTDKQVTNPIFSGSNIVDDMYLVDGTSKKKYLVVRDAENKPVGYYGPTQAVPAKAVIQAWGRFPAPTSPKIMVSVPGVPPFEEVPIN